MSSNTSKTTSTASKRRSTLAELGIKPNAPTAQPGSPTPTNKTFTAQSTTGVNRRASITGTRASKTPGTTRPRPLSMVGTSAQQRPPLSPTVQRSTSNSVTRSASTTRKTPAAINTTRAAASRATATPSPTTATAAKRRSVIGTSSNQPPTTPVPRARASTISKQRSSTPPTTVGSPSPSSSAVVAKEQQIKELEKMLADKEKQLESKDQLIQEMQAKMADLSGSEKSYDPTTPMLSSSSMLIPCDSSVDSEKEIKLDMDKLKNQYQSEIDSVRQQLVEAHDEKSTADQTTTEVRKERTSIQLMHTIVDSLPVEKELRDTTHEDLDARYKKEMEQLTLQHEQKLKDEMQRLIAEHEQKIQSFTKDHEQKIESLTKDQGQKTESLTKDHEHKVETLIEEHKTRFEQVQKDHEEKLQKALDEKKAIEQRLADLEKTLQDSNSVSHLRRLERQLDDTQNEFDEYKRQMQQSAEATERRYREEMQQLQSGNDDTAEAWLDKHRAAQQEISRLQTVIQDMQRDHAQALEEQREQHEISQEEWMAKSEAQENEMDNQAQQITSLLTQVEDMQNSLEAATARLEQRTSSRKASSENMLLQQSGGDHRACEEKLQARQREIEELHRRVAELQETRDTQLNRLGHEKARELQELRDEIKSTKEQLHTAQTTDDKRLLQAVEQHNKELHVLHQQYQKLVDLKDHELEEYAYRVKTITAGKMKEMEELRAEHREKIKDFEVKIQDYQKRIQQFEQQADELLMKCASYQDENSQLSKLLQQLQGELHGGQV